MEFPNIKNKLLMVLLVLWLKVVFNIYIIPTQTILKMFKERKSLNTSIKVSEKEEEMERLDEEL
jgi:hypothetical protein